MQLSFRARLTLALIAAAVLPLAALGLLMWATGAGGSGAPGSKIDLVVLLGLLLAAFAGVALAVGLETVLLAPLRGVLGAAKRWADGERGGRIVAPGEDELGQVAEHYNRLVTEVEHRDRIIQGIRDGVAAMDPAGGPAAIAAAAEGVARSTFGMTEARVVLGNPDDLPERPRIPGEAYEVRAILRVGPERLGAIVGSLPPARAWNATDQALLDLLAAEVAVAQWSVRTAVDGAGPRRHQPSAAVTK